MSESALDRVSRALDLIPFITHNPGLSVVQIAERFNSTPSQISKDLSLLHMCGLPGYSHLELLDIDYEDPNYISVKQAQVLDQPRSLTEVEALTLILGLNILLELSSSDQEREVIVALQEKLKARYGEGFAKSITTKAAIIESPVASQILSAIADGRILTLTYNSATSDSITVREVYPISIDYLHGVGYLRALTVPKGDERSFRLDRIVTLELGKEDRDFAKQFNLGSLSHSDEFVEIEMGPDGLFFIEKHQVIVTLLSGAGRTVQDHAFC
ncbi:MAG: WYL domain-containing protein [Actinomycetota bacterium]